MSSELVFDDEQKDEEINENGWLGQYTCKIDWEVICY